MKRRLGAILLLLVAGAIVNVAVAWGCGTNAASPYMRPVEHRLKIDEVATLWSRFVGNDRFGPHVVGVRMVRPATTVTSFGERLLVASDSTLLPSDKGWATTVDIVDAGLPWRALSHCFKWDMARLDDVMNHLPARPPNSIDWLRESRILWPGFAINTVFYAAILWGLFAAPFALRQRRRLKHGLCPACAYPVGTSDKCTECGAVLRAQPQRGASTSAQGNALGNGHAPTPKP